MNMVVAQMLASSISNITGLVLGFPLDTVNTRIQISEPKQSALKITRDVFKFEGTKGFFKGLMGPLIVDTPYICMTFTMTEYLTHKLSVNTNYKEHQKRAIAGAGAGLLFVLLYNPIELLKVQAQINERGNLDYNREIKSIFRNNGLKGFYRGIWPQLLQDVPGWAIYFAAYSYLKEYLGVQRDVEDIDYCKECEFTSLEQLGRMALAGGLAGQIALIISYPFDVINTYVKSGKMQHTDTCKVPTMKQVALQGYQSCGPKFFFKGLSPMLIHSFYTNAACLPIFDLCNYYFCKKLKGD